MLRCRHLVGVFTFVVDLTTLSPGHTAHGQMIVLCIKKRTRNDVEGVGGGRHRDIIEGSSPAVFGGTGERHEKLYPA